MIKVIETIKVIKMTKVYRSDLSDQSDQSEHSEQSEQSEKKEMASLLCSHLSIFEYSCQKYRMSNCNKLTLYCGKVGKEVILRYILQVASSDL